MKRLLALGAVPLVLACGAGAREKPPPIVAVAVPAGHVRLVVGGDSRDDGSHVLPWAFRVAKAYGASAFVFLGDMELTPSFDAHFRGELALLGGVPFYPILGNHEVKLFGFFNLGHDAAEEEFREHFLGTKLTPIRSSLPGKVVYSVNLPGHVHFVALDNVSQKGFGEDQLAWLQKDLEQAAGDPDVRHIFVGMHKPLAHNGISHGMEEDGPVAEKDSAEALTLFQREHVEVVFASHVHEFARFFQGGIRSYVTGGLGAPLVRSAGKNAFHHLLVVDVAGDAVTVDVVRFDGKPTYAPDNVADDPGD